MRENPWQSLDGTWWWYDEGVSAHGPYTTQSAALYAVLQHMDPTAKKRATHEGWNIVFFVTGAVIVALAWWLS